MSLLSDYDIKAALERKYLQIQPPPLGDAIQSASVDLSLGSKFATYRELGPDIDPFNPEPLVPFVIENSNLPFRLMPGQFALGHTGEVITLGKALAGQVDGKSSLGRMGLFVHCTAGFIDPGFTGQVTLELFNAAPRPILLRPGMLICQLVLHRVTSTVQRPYGHAELGSRYQNTLGPVSSRYGHARPVVGVDYGYPDLPGVYLTGRGAVPGMLEAETPGDATEREAG